MSKVLTRGKRISLQSQIEEVVQTIARLKKEKPNKMDASEHEFRLERLEQVLRTLHYLLKYKDEFLKLIEEKGDA